MSKVIYFVGLDYHQHSVQVCVMDKDGEILTNATRPNDWAQVAEIVPEGGLGFAAIEACCGAADFAEELINRAGWSVDLAHPGYVARIKQSPDKTDWGDARRLADLERVGYLPKEIGRFDRFRTGKQLARFCALTPRNASSGERQADAGLIRAGNQELRRVLIEAAQRLQQYNDYWAQFAERLKDRGKAPNVITAAIANRWVRGLYYEMAQLAA